MEQKVQKDFVEILAIVKQNYVQDKLKKSYEKVQYSVEKWP